MRPDEEAEPRLPLPPQGGRGCTGDHGVSNFFMEEEAVRVQRRHLYSREQAKMCSEGAQMEKKRDRKMKGRTDKPKVHPNIDGGWAWMVVLSSFLVHLLVMGSQMALGILNMEWLEEFNQSRGLTAWVSSLTMGITLIVGPFIGLFINTCGCRKTAMIGGFLTSLGWVLSAFATNVYFLFFTFGVTAGIGSGMVYLPAVVMVGQYFQKHRALAQGLSTTGTGFGTFLITVLLKYLCAEFGWRNAMIIQGAVTLNLCVCGALMRPLASRVQCSAETTSDHQGKKEASPLDADAVKPNNGLHDEEDGECRTDTAASWSKEATSNEIVVKDARRLGILKSLTRMTVSVRSGFWIWYSSYFGAASLFTNKVFVAFVLWALLAYCSFVIPFIHLPEIVELYGMSEQNNIFPLTSIIAIVHIFGKIILGFLGDLSCVSAWNVFIASNFTLGICILILPLMQIYTALAVVCALIGFSSGYFSLMPVVTEDLVGIKQLANAYGIIICANGISALLGPPFAGWIFDITQKYDYSFYVCGFLYMLGIICLLLEPCLQPKEKNDEKPVENQEV